MHLLLAVAASALQGARVEVATAAQLRSIGLMRTVVFRPELTSSRQRQLQSRAFVDAMKRKTSVLVALVGERVMGSADLLVEDVGAWGTASYVVNVCVRDEARRQGLGRRLVQSAEQRGVDEGAEAMVLHVDVDNAAARRLYEAMGYVELDAQSSLGAHFTGDDFVGGADGASPPSAPQLLMAKPLVAGAALSLPASPPALLSAPPPLLGLPIE